MYNKEGFSLMVLTITIIVMIILASVVIFYVNDTMVNSKMAAFALDINNVEDLVYEYYLNNNELPKYSDTEYDKEDIIGFVAEGSDDLSKEITANNDDDEKFYIIDLGKLSVKSTNKGLQMGEGSPDKYLVTKDSMNVYYLKGERIGKKYYFSLTKELIKKTELEINKTQDDSTLDIIYTTTSINYRKSTKEWTNNLTVKIETELEADETLAYSLAGIDITESVTTNIVNVSDILSSNEEIKNAFYDSNNSKVLKIQKIKNEEIVAEANVDVSNLDILTGNTITQDNVTYTKYSNYILAKITDYTDLGESGLKEVRVLYITKLDSDGNSVSYYNNIPNPITKEYIYSMGTINKGLLLKLPSDVISYSLIFVDNAGNISDINTFTVTD